MAINSFNVENEKILTNGNILGINFKAALVMLL